MPTMHLLAWAACLAGAAYFAVVCQLACVVSLLEDAMLFRALRKSRALLAGKFWAAAGVFVTLDGCIFAVLAAFPVLVGGRCAGPRPRVPAGRRGGDGGGSVRGRAVDAGGAAGGLHGVQEPPPRGRRQGSPRL
uniref:Uncharacterized protein n=1 Tax=Triticum urartu TaxID=4572 RepID=A0A8R7NXQ0_TRIUA